MSEPKNEPEDLLERARKGDQNAFSSLVARSTVPLLVFMRKHARGAFAGDCDAEDLLQLVLSRAWIALPEATELTSSTIHRWLVSFCRSALSDRWKYLEAKGRGDVLSMGSVAESSAADPPFADDATSIGSRAALREEVARAEVALAELPDSQREVIERYFLLGESLGEIARALGVRKNAIFERLHRGMSHLRAKLASMNDVPSSVTPA